AQKLFVTFIVGRLRYPCTLLNRSLEKSSLMKTGYYYSF
ncbi:MAG: hypothetical protein ACI9C4_001463, partial [Paraglaciecola sp.]